MRDKIQPRAAAIVETYNMPRWVFCILGFQHLIPAQEYAYHLLREWQVHPAKLALRQRVLDACLKATLLLLVADFQPEFDQLDAGIGDVFSHGSDSEKALVSSLEQNPVTYSTPARLYQPRSKIPISRAARKC
jgi:hypothetical protein